MGKGTKENPILRGFFTFGVLLVGTVGIVFTPALLTTKATQPLTTGLVGYWSFDEGSGNIAHDSSGYGNHGTIYGASWTTGVRNSALSFNGINNEVEVPDDPVLNFHNINQFSISLWINRKGSLIETVEGVISKGTLAYHRGYNIHIRQDDTIGFGIRNGTSYWCISNRKIGLNRWYHIVTVWDGSILYIFINGKLDNSIYLGNVTIADDYKYLQIGNHYFDHPFHGLIDEVRIYNKALSKEEIQELYHHLFHLFKSAEKYLVNLPQWVLSLFKNKLYSLQ